MKLFIGTLGLNIPIANLFFEGPGTITRLLPGFLFCVVWQQSDLFWHLGLNRQVKTGELLPTVGIANTLTWMRALGASFLLGRLIGGDCSPSLVALLFLFCGGVADILWLQGPRYNQKPNKMGENDHCWAD